MDILHTLSGHLCLLVQSLRMNHELSSLTQTSIKHSWTQLFHEWCALHWLDLMHGSIHKIQIFLHKLINWPWRQSILCPRVLFRPDVSHWALRSIVHLSQRKGIMLFIVALVETEADLTGWWTALPCPVGRMAHQPLQWPYMVHLILMSST